MTNSGELFYKSKIVYQIQQINTQQQLIFYFVGNQLILYRQLQNSKKSIQQHKKSIQQMLRQQISQEYRNCLKERIISLQQISQLSPEQLLEIFTQKEQLIRGLSRQMTKCKADESKSKKLIQNLQTKIQKLTPSTSDTSSDFMMPSQFKSLFQNFMSNTVPNLFGIFVQFPLVYSKLFKMVINNCFNQIKSLIDSKMQRIVIQLGFKETEDDISLIKRQIFMSNLSFLQKNYKKIMPFSIKDCKQNKLINITKKQQLQLLQQFEENEDLGEFLSQLYEICVYMILQQNSWQFIFEQSNNDISLSPFQIAKQNVMKYDKKMHNCIDGFLKERKLGLCLLKGIATSTKQTLVIGGNKSVGLQNQSYRQTFHPNLKNYLIPFPYDIENNQQQIQENDQTYCEDIGLCNSIDLIKIICFEKIQNKKGFIKEQKCHQIQQSRVKEMPKKDQIKQTQRRKIETEIKISSNYQIQHEKELAGILNQKNENINHQEKKLSDQNQIHHFFNKPISKSAILIKAETQKKQLPPFKHKPFKIQQLAQAPTEKSQMLQSLVFAFNERQNRHNNKQNKENFNVFNNFVSEEDIIESSQFQMKKDKKNDKSSKKSKKQKNSSVIDLTQKKKLSKVRNSHTKQDKPEKFKEPNGNASITNCKKTESNLPLSRQPILNKGKKVAPKGNGKQSRKGSVGKIISQNSQMFGVNNLSKQHKEKHLSHSNTIAVKQLIKMNDKHSESVKRQKQKVREQDAKKDQHKSKKSVYRIQETTNLIKANQDSITQNSREERPLKVYSHHLMVGKLRQKYLS